MPISPSDFNAAISPNPVRVTVGMNGNVNLSFSNTSLTERGYNLTVNLKLPDGVSYAGGLIPPNSIINNPDGTILLTWTNIKDLYPNEIAYVLGVTLHADETFRSTGQIVPFDVPLASVVLDGTVDTLPRGNDDPGNMKITKSDSANFIPLRYNLTKSAPGKYPKGAGILSPYTAPRWIYTYTLTVENNSRDPSTVTLVDNLPNGVRYLGGLSVSGMDSAALSSPTVITPSPGPDCQDFVTLDWGTVTLSPISVNTITFNAAIWDNYTSGCVENSGARIPHMTAMLNIATLDGLSGSVHGQTATKAMDATITKIVASGSTDVGKINNYTLVYRINQYDNVDSFVVTDTIGDGQTYIEGSASLPPVPPVPPKNVDGTTTLTWDLGLLAAGATGSIIFKTTTDADYYIGGPVSAGDTLIDNVNISGINQTALAPVPDNSSAATSIGVPNITKQLINYFYKDGSVKSYSVAAPGDMVGFLITYSSTGIAAQQRNIEIDEYAPLNMGPLTASLPVTYGGTLGTSFSPFTVSPNGLRWALGTVPGNSLWTADFKVSVQDIDFVGTRNNLAKLTGLNTEGYAYSDRDQTAVNFGQPNITLTKTVAGPDVNAVKAGETYTYSITIANPESIDGNTTDAFQMDLTDVIPADLIHTGTYSVTGTGDYSTPVFAGQNVSMTILKLAPGDSLTFSYNVLVTLSVVSGQSYINNAVLQRPYSQPDRSYQFIGEPFTAFTTLRAKGIILTKLLSPGTARIGDKVTYILQAAVPQGTIAYKVQVVDAFPFSTQSYQGNAAQDGSPVTPVVLGGTVTFPVIPFVNATAAAVTITYTFDIRVTGGTHVSPFVQNQVDNATVYWDLNNTGTHAVPYSTSAALLVKTPNLTLRKEQSKGGSYTTGSLSYNIGDVISYRITVTNTGAETAFNTVITDVLNLLLSFNTGSISTTAGTASEAGGTVTWNIPALASTASARLTFTVNTLPGVPADGSVTDRATIVSYNTNNNGFGISYGPVNSNQVQLIPPAVAIAKSASPNLSEIGDNITYTITITVQNGTIAYTPKITDTIPLGQTFNTGSATRQELPNPPVSVAPSVSGQTITFTNPNINASGGARTIIYTFTARITNGTHNPPYQETQTDTAIVSWAIVSGGPFARSRTALASITARTPNIIILKEQKDVTTGGSYTTLDISAIPTDVIYYRLTITSNGASPAYNINLQDVLSSKITFVSTISGPTAGTVALPPPGPGGALLWHIDQLDNGLTAVYEFQVDINAGIGSGDSIPDSATATYDSNDVNPITYSQASNQVFIDIPLIEFIKTSLSSTAAIGSTVQYMLTINIPPEVAIYNMVIKDVLPSGQQYVPGSFTAIPPPLGTVTVSGSQITYTDPVLSRVGPLTLNYTFQALVASGTTAPPYTEVQRNMADVFWEITPAGPQAPPVSSFADVMVQSPHITALKEQRLLPNGAFTTNPLLGIATSDNVEYRINLTNDGAGDAYNIVTTDDLDPFLTFLGLVSASAGTVTPPPGPPYGPDGTVTWTINSGTIPSGGQAVLIFQVDVNTGPAPGTAVSDQSSTLYDTFSINGETLGPVHSNQVAFNYNHPEITKSADKTGLFVGDIVTYGVKIIIPEGNIAYNVQFTDVLPGEQSYVPDSLTLDYAPVIPDSTNPLKAPSILVVDAIAGAVTLSYTFQADVNSITIPPQQAQLDTATVSWTLDYEGQNPGPPQSANTTVYVTDSDITVLKGQSTDPAGPFVPSVIGVIPGSSIYYQLAVTNPGAFTIYNVAVVDSFDSLVNVVNITPETGTAGIIDNSINWMISSIAPSVTYTALVKCTVLPGGGVESTIPDYFTGTFTATDTQPLITYGPRTSNTVEAQLPSAQFAKAVSSSTVELGTVITYTLDVTIPAGTIAYNVLVTDTLPEGQVYVGYAFIGENHVNQIVEGQVVTFPILDIIDATLGEVTVSFVFDARVVTGNELPPYTETQTNKAVLKYAIDQSGTPANPINTSLDVTVTSPDLSVVKQHRNVTQDTGYRFIPLSVEVGDIVRFRLDATSFGASPAYSVVVLDALDIFTGFIGFVSATSGTPSYDLLSRTVTWSIDSIATGNTEILIFEVEILSGEGAGGSSLNTASYTYGSNQQTPIVIGPLDTNTVAQEYPNVVVTKASDIQNATIGSIITYTVVFTLPRGTVAYNAQFVDVLHVGQQYNNNASLNGTPIVPDSVNGQQVVFPKVSFASAINGTKTYTYVYQAQVVSANVDPVTHIEVQTNDAKGSWYFDPVTPAPPVDALEDVNVTDFSVTLQKLQRNVSAGQDFTTLEISGKNDQTVEYKLSVTNNGPGVIYDVIVTDTLSSDLSFLAFTVVPEGSLVHSGETSGGTVTWSFDSLEPGLSLAAVFSVKIVRNSEGTIPDAASLSFRISQEDPNRYGGINSNTVVIKASAAPARGARGIALSEILKLGELIELSDNQ